jgi:hypothetical protein
MLCAANPGGCLLRVDYPAIEEPVEVRTCAGRRQLLAAIGVVGIKQKREYPATDDEVRLQRAACRGGVCFRR